MKKRGNFMLCIGIVACVLCTTSCEQPDGETEFINTNDKEGFKSTTGNSDRFIEDEDTKTEKPVLHLQFDEQLSEEDRQARFDKAVALYVSGEDVQSKGVSTEWYYRIATYTGTQSGNGTDAMIRAAVHFKTDKGYKYVNNIKLDNLDDDHEMGKWDYYLFKTSFPGQAVSWVQIKSSEIRLLGTDGWFLKQFHTYMVASDQTVPASGSTNIYSFPNVWLDNTCMRCWDTYEVSASYSGKLFF